MASAEWPVLVSSGVFERECKGGNYYYVPSVGAPSGEHCLLRILFLRLSSTQPAIAQSSYVAKASLQVNVENCWNRNAQEKNLLFVRFLFGELRQESAWP